MYFDRLHQRCTTFLAQGAQFIILSALEGRRQNYDLNFQKLSGKNRNIFYLTSLFDACGLILMLSALFRTVISCKIVDSSMKFKFFHKISVVQKKFLLLFKRQRGPDIMRSGPDLARGPRLCIPELHPAVNYAAVYI